MGQVQREKENRKMSEELKKAGSSKFGTAESVSSDGAPFEKKWDGRQDQAAATMEPESRARNGENLDDDKQDTQIKIKFPQENEQIFSPTYSARLELTGPCDAVEIRMDDGPWQSCRTSVGYWWFDWETLLPGFHGMEARALCGDRLVAESGIRLFEVPGP